MEGIEIKLLRKGAIGTGFEHGGIGFVEPPHGSARKTQGCDGFGGKGESKGVGRAAIGARQVNTGDGNLRRGEAVGLGMEQTTTTQEDFLALAVDSYDVHGFDAGQTIEGIAHIEHGRKFDQQVTATAAQGFREGANIGFAGFDAYDFSADFIATSRIEKEDIDGRKGRKVVQGIGMDSASVRETEQGKVVGGEFDQFGIALDIDGLCARSGHE